MEIDIPLSGDIALRIKNSSPGERGYPSSRLQKGLILLNNGRELVEEGVGFGVPILKKGRHTLFAGDLDLESGQEGGQQIIKARFEMNLEEKIATEKNGNIENRPVYRVKNFLAWLIRTYPALRSPLTALSNALRALFNWQTTYQKVDSHGEVLVAYHIDRAAGVVKMTVSAEGVVNEAITEMVVMNEQGANAFKRYRDSDGSDLQGEQIGCWDEVKAAQATFISDQYQIAYTLEQVEGARLFRGRELIGSRLAWSGFGYSYPAGVKRFECTLKIERTP